MSYIEYSMSRIRVYGETNPNEVRKALRLASWEQHNKRIAKVRGLSSKRLAPNKVCSFCGRNSSQVSRIIEGPPGHAICNECIDVCYTLLYRKT